VDSNGKPMFKKNEYGGAAKGKKLVSVFEQNMIREAEEKEAR